VCSHFYSANFRCGPKPESLSKRFNGSEIVKQLSVFTPREIFIAVPRLSWVNLIEMVCMGVDWICLVEDMIHRVLKGIVTFLFYVYTRRRISLPAVQVNFIKYPIRYRLSAHPSSCTLPCVTGALVETQKTSSC
jgi:hypothetical protein